MGNVFGFVRKALQGKSGFDRDFAVSLEESFSKTVRES